MTFVSALQLLCTPLPPVRVSSPQVEKSAETLRPSLSCNLSVLDSVTSKNANGTLLLMGSACASRASARICPGACSVDRLDFHSSKGEGQTISTDTF